MNNYVIKIVTQQKKHL